jgi:hypothetical protein
MEEPRPLYPGVAAYQKKDSTYRDAYRGSGEAKLRSYIEETCKKFYDILYKGLSEASDATTPLAEFLGALAHKLPPEPRYLASKLRWTSLEYVFASTWQHFQKDRLAYEYQFYCASALTAVDALIDYCDRWSQVPYVFIVTTQLPNEYFSDPKDKGAVREDFGYSFARQQYIKLFRDKISQRRDELRSLIVERHTLVAADDQETKSWPGTPRYLSKEDSWLATPSSDPNYLKAELAQWLNGNHHWHVGGVLPPASIAYINKIRKDHLPTNVPQEDENMCIDLIVFGAAEAKRENLATVWKFGIGVFGAVQPEKFQGRFVKLFSGEELQSKNRFPLLGYEVPNFESLIRALHGQNSSIDRRQFIGLEQSKLLVDTWPWSEWVDKTTRSEAKKKQTRFTRSCVDTPETLQPAEVLPSAEPLPSVDESPPLDVFPPVLLPAVPPPSEARPSPEGNYPRLGWSAPIVEHPSPGKLPGSGKGGLMRRIALGSFIGSAAWHFGWEAVRAWLYERGFHFVNPYLFGIPLGSLVHYGVMIVLVAIGLWLFWKTRQKSDPNTSL